MVDISNYAYETGKLDSPGDSAATTNSHYQVSITANFEELRDVWVNFENEALCTPFQNYSWLESWHREIGMPNGVTPCLFHGRAKNGRTLFILPLGYWRHAGSRVLGWLGDEHSNYKMGVFDRNWIKTLTPFEARMILEKILVFLPPIDVIRLCAGPSEWEGIANPFTKLSALPSASYSHAITLQADFEALYASKRSASTIKKARKRERSFNRHYKLEFALARERDEIQDILNEVYRQKAFRLAEMGVHNFFADPGVKEFFNQTAMMQGRHGDNPFHLFYLKAGDKIAATWMGIAHRGRMCGMMNTMSSEAELRKHSPGEVLLRHAIKYCCENGFHTFDLAVGESRYKNEWCDQTLPLYETILPISLFGYLHVQGSKARLKIKRLIKQSDRLWSLSKKLRAWLARWARAIFGLGLNPSCKSKGDR